MEFPSSQLTEFFDAQEEPDNDRNGLQSPPLMSPNRSEGSNFRESCSPRAQDQLPFMQLFPPPTDQFYPTLRALLIDANKTAFRQGYNIVRDGGDRKDKDGNLRKLRLKCTKGGGYKDEGERTKQGGRQRRRQRTNCSWKAYASRTAEGWCIRIVEAEHNHPAVAPEAFAANRKFSQADIAIIKDDIKAHIPPIKKLGRLHDLNPSKYLTLQDLHNQRSQLRRKKLAYFTLIQHLLQELQTSGQWVTAYQLDGYEQLTHLFFAFESSLDYYRCTQMFFLLTALIRPTSTICLCASFLELRPATSPFMLVLLFCRMRIKTLIIGLLAKS